ncbi:hypothetical protein EMCRGX_G010323 [Ephydatia muelleri]
MLIVHNCNKYTCTFGVTRLFANMTVIGLMAAPKIHLKSVRSMQRNTPGLLDRRIGPKDMFIVLLYIAANGWNDAVKAAKLPTLLDGEALAVWLELDEDVQKDYKRAKQKIVDVLMPTEFVTLDKFHNRRLLPGEALSVFVDDLKKLLSHAMPGIEANAKDQLLLHQLMAGLPTSITKQLRASGEIKNFNDTCSSAS